MGVCASCLGLGRKSSESDPSDTSHLLGEGYQPQYGSLHASGPHGGPQLDPEEIRRQRDALERLCAQTSDKLIDVTQSTNTEDGSKMMTEYPRLFSERFPSTQPPGSISSSSTLPSEEDEATWVERVVGEDWRETGQWERVEGTESGALSMQFDEVLGAALKGGRS